MATPRILLVGGNRLVVEMLMEHVHHNHLYELRWVEYCDQALAMLEQEPFDLILVLSLHVPWTVWSASAYSPEWRADLLNAILFLKHLRTIDRPPSIILVTGSPLAEAKEEALANGAFAVIPKPFALTEFDRFVQLALESRKGVQ